MKGLTELQSEILRRFFAQRQDFFLTGGAALVGFYLSHRETHDLDLFTAGGALDEGERTLRQIATELELEFESVRRDPAFQRFLVRRRQGDESLVIDLVRDDVPQLAAKRIISGIRIDSAEEILNAKAAEAKAAAAEAQAANEADKQAAADVRLQAQQARADAAAQREQLRLQREQERLQSQRERQQAQSEARAAREAARPTMADKVIQSATRAAASSVGRQLGNQLLRGILGGLMRGR